LTYSEAFAPTTARSDSCLPANGPSSLSAVNVPVSDTSFIGESYLNNVTTTGPFSPCLPRCICPAVTPSMFVAFTLYATESSLGINSATPVAAV
jgi:hypothetical protein